MLASLALVPAAIGVLAPSGPDDGCPSPRQVVEALGAHLPGVALPLGQAPGPSALRLRVATDAAGVTRLDLGDAQGETVLHRAFVPADRMPACEALAETVALVIERYWREVGYDVPPLELPPPTPPAPPPPTPPPAPPPSRATGPEPRSGPSPAPAWRWSVGGLASVRSDHGALGAAGLAVGVQGRIGLRLSGQITEADATTFSFATAHFRRYPLRLGAFLPLRVGLGQLEPGIGLDWEEISLGLTHVTAGPNATLAHNSLCTGAFCASPGVDLALGWSAWSTHHVFVRALARAAVAVPYRFTAAQSGATVWSTPRTYLEAGIECGVWFP
jgi:hypothetical protein